MDNHWLRRLESYTAKRLGEVLLVTAEIDGEMDHVVIFRGYSSSLMRSTEFDPDVPVLPSHANVRSIDRLASPYDPASPQYIQRDLDWEAIAPLLVEAGV